jgi:hypothetical protein
VESFLAEHLYGGANESLAPVANKIGVFGIVLTGRLTSGVPGRISLADPAFALNSTPSPESRPMLKVRRPSLDRYRRIRSAECQQLAFTSLPVLQQCL